MEMSETDRTGSLPCHLGHSLIMRDALVDSVESARGSDNFFKADEQLLESAVSESSQAPQKKASTISRPKFCRCHGQFNDSKTSTQPNLRPIKEARPQISASSVKPDALDHIDL